MFQKRPGSAVGFVSWKDPQDVQNALMGIAPKADPPIAYTQPPFGGLNRLKAYHIASLLRCVAVEGSGDTFQKPGIEVVSVFECTLRPGDAPLHLIPQRRFTSSWDTTRPS